jgi:hypothetical protein
MKQNKVPTNIRKMGKRKSRDKQKGHIAQNIKDNSAPK